MLPKFRPYGTTVVTTAATVRVLTKHIVGLKNAINRRDTEDAEKYSAFGETRQTVICFCFQEASDSDGEKLHAEVRPGWSGLFEPEMDMRVGPASSDSLSADRQARQPPK